MVDFGESSKMIKICGKVEKSNTYNGFNGNISFFINRGTSSDSLNRKIFTMLNAQKCQAISQ